MYRVKFLDILTKAQYNLEGSPRAVHCVNDMLVYMYETEAGGVTKRTTAFVNGLPRVGHKLIRTDGHGLVVLRPGGVWCYTTYDGDPLRYWRFRGEHKAAMGQDILDPLPTTRVGPYEMYWGESGWDPGGQGIDPNWFAWRKCPRGYLRAFQEAEATIMRNPVAYLWRDGTPMWFHSDRFAMGNGCDRPEGYKAMPSDELLDRVEYLPALMRYKPHDGQHYHRAYRAALALKDIDPFCADLCRWYQNHMHMEWLPDSKCDDDPHYFWSSKQRLNRIQTNPGVPDPDMGREVAHCARLEWSLNPDSMLSNVFEEMFKGASDPTTGVPYLTTISHENGNAYKWWPVGTPCAQTFQWSLLLAAMGMRPGLSMETARFRDYFAPQSRWCADNAYRQAGSLVPYMHLMRGDLQGQSLEYWATKCNYVDAHGSQPLNYLPAEVWL